MILETRLAKLRLKVERDYSLLPPFLQDAVDKRCPKQDSFESREEELKYLEKRASRLASLWLGMYSGVSLVIVMVIGVGVELVRALINAVSSML